MNKTKLHTLAISARERSYSPYSKFKVGSAMLFEDGSTFSGCNIENSSFGGTICAERVALLKAISEKNDPQESKRPLLKEVMVVTDSPKGDYPCGICLQSISEFADQDTLVHIANTKEIFETYRFQELMTKPFDASSLN
jgi:cytidine deaminase